MGIRCSATRSLIFTECLVPAENLIGGREGWGSIILLNTLNRTRIGVGAQAVGAAQGAFEEALKYARERKQFGRSIADFQIIRHKLVKMEMSIEAARSIVYKAATYADNDAPKDTVAKFGAIAKCFSSDMAMVVTVDAVQVFGGYGFSREYPPEKFMRDAKILQIYEGTNEIQRNEIAAILVKTVSSVGVKMISGFPEADDHLNLARDDFLRSFCFAKENGLLGESAQIFRHAFADMDMAIETALAFAERAAQMEDIRLEKMALCFVKSVARSVRIASERILAGDLSAYEKTVLDLANGLTENISS